ncbi:ornithine carbamoyltransferase [Pelagibacteraceae bacterium]|nr:ornithine carbamoyltransferase [Pelagibacteraceae bacterium]
MKHFIDLADFSVKKLNTIIKTAKQIKKNPKKFAYKCKDKTLGMIFQKESTRTRVSFNVGFKKLGGHSIELNAESIGFGKRENYQDIVRTLSQYIDILMIRNDDHNIIRDLSALNFLPIINGLSDFSHPCQILSDFLTINEKLGNIKNQRICWVGDYNNVLRSLIELQSLYKFQLNVVIPKEILNKNKTKILKKNNTNLMATNSINEGIKHANCVMTDAWVSMGEKSIKKKYFKNYQVNSDIMKDASKEAIFMHCLPAHRDEEVSSELLDSKQSVVWEQVQNRMFVQQAIILDLL